MSLFTSPTYSFLDLVKGDSATYHLTFTEDNVAYNLTNASEIWFTLKNSPEDTDAEALLQLTLSGGSIVILSAAGGTANLDITAAQTATLDYGRVYYWDIQVKDTSNQIFTALRGRLLIRSQSTISTS